MLKCARAASRITSGIVAVFQSSRGTQSARASTIGSFARLAFEEGGDASLPSAAIGIGRTEAGLPAVWTRDAPSAAPARTSGSVARMERSRFFISLRGLRNTGQRWEDSDRVASDHPLGVFLEGEGDELAALAARCAAQVLERGGRGGAGGVDRLQRGAVG